MPRHQEDSHRPGTGDWRFWLKGRLPLETETAVFILVNVLDTLLTILLVAWLDGFNEGNPVAGFFLNHWGLRGLIYYKLAMVAFVCVIAQLIATQSTKTARRLLYGLTAIVGIVVLYSAVLMSRAF